MPWSDFTDIERSFNKVHPLHEVMFLAGVMGGI